MKTKKTVTRYEWDNFEKEWRPTHKTETVEDAPVIDCGNLTNWLRRWRNRIDK